MQVPSFVELETPRIEESKQLRIAGLRGTFTYETRQDIPELWRRFGARVGTIPGAVRKAVYGLGFNACSGQSEIDYMAGIAVSKFGGLPGDLARVTIPAGRYAVFPHRLNVSRIGDAVNAIWQTWLPDSGYEIAQTAGAPDLIERYGAGFNPATGIGDIELWIPIKPKAS